MGANLDGSPDNIFAFVDLEVDPPDWAVTSGTIAEELLCFTVGIREDQTCQVDLLEQHSHLRKLLLLQIDLVAWRDLAELWGGVSVVQSELAGVPEAPNRECYRLHLERRKGLVHHGDLNDFRLGPDVSLQRLKHGRGVGDRPDDGRLAK